MGIHACEASEGIAAKQLYQHLPSRHLTRRYCLLLSENIKFHGEKCLLQKLLFSGIPKIYNMYTNHQNSHTYLMPGFHKTLCIKETAEMETTEQASLKQKQLVTEPAINVTLLHFNELLIIISIRGL